MRFKPMLALLLAFAASCAAQDKMMDTLRKGVVEEDSKQNLAGAIQDYQSVLAQYNDARQTAATALFRMAECYRKEGKQTEAMAAYGRVIKEFADQRKLAEQSSGVLTKTYHLEVVKEAQTTTAAQKEQQAKTDEARARYRSTITKEMEMVTAQADRIKQLQKIGAVSSDGLESVNMRLLQLERELAAFDAGMPSPGAR